ncbi:MAG: hypothetical protein OK439_04705 [Thaumarchaeota archaeon]|nr:hypothetical protein [Nitrososphaerota archaeon]
MEEQLGISGYRGIVPGKLDSQTYGIYSSEDNNPGIRVRYQSRSFVDEIRSRRYSSIRYRSSYQFNRSDETITVTDSQEREVLTHNRTSTTKDEEASVQTENSDSEEAMLLAVTAWYLMLLVSHYDGSDDVSFIGTLTAIIGSSV